MEQNAVTFAELLSAVKNKMCIKGMVEFRISIVFQYFLRILV